MASLKVSKAGTLNTFQMFTLPTPTDQVFGTDLAKLYEQAKNQVPPFLLHFLNHIERKGLESTGIYRLSGNAASVTKLRYLVEQGGSEDFILFAVWIGLHMIPSDQKIDLDDPQWADINIVTGCLKLFFRELPDPLIPFRLFKSYIETASKYHCQVK